MADSPRPVLEVARELEWLARDSANAPDPEPEKLARRVDTLLQELAGLSGTREAADVLVLLLQAEVFASLQAPGRMTCRAEAVEVLSRWGYLDRVSRGDRKHWRQQRDSGGGAPAISAINGSPWERAERERPGLLQRLLSVFRRDG